MSTINDSSRPQGGREHSGTERRFLGVIHLGLRSGSSIYHLDILEQFSQPFSNSVSVSIKWGYSYISCDSCDGK